MILSRDPEGTCPSTQIYHERSYVVEIWAWTILGVVTFAARYAVRLRILPWRKLQCDDWMGIAVLLFFIGLTGVKLTVYYFGANSDYTEEEIIKLSACQIRRITFSTKLYVSAWYFYACFLWGLKAMVLFLFNRLTLSPLQRRCLKLYAVISILTWIAVVLVISLGCRPFSANWGTVPYPPFHCTGRTQNFYTASVLNIVTDALIISIALPMLWNLRVPLRRKIGLTLLLCSGIFVITAALVAMLMSVLDADSTMNTNRWATREEIAGILAVNAPIIKPMFTRAFWRRDFPAVKSRGARTGPQHPLGDPRLLMETPRLVEVGKLGVLSSLPSGFSTTRTRSRDGASSRKGSAEKGSDIEVGIDLEEMGSWEGRRQAGNAISYPSFALLPEPASRLSSMRADSFSWLDLQAIREEDDKEKSGEEEVC